MMKKTEIKVEEFIRKYHMIEEGDRVIAGVSGGADSVCLLFYALQACGEKMKFQILVCHVNHGLRGAEADADEKFVEELCERLGVPCRIFRENVELTARKRNNLLKRRGVWCGARRLRPCAESTAERRSRRRIIRDDNAETMLLNLARGTGLNGLCGIRPVRERWIRPLLCLGRKEIEEWLESRNTAI